MEAGQKFDRIIKKQVFNGEELEVVYRRARRPLNKEELAKLNGAVTFAFRPDFNQRTYVAEPGIICEQDVAVKLRDGVTIYVDIFRPENMTDIPALVSWSFFGKRPGDGQDEWKIMGVPPGTVSNMAKFESPDPGYWCRHGYAVVNADLRGTGHSEGDLSMFGRQDALDGYDCIEWIAQQPWCSGKVGMGGNSGVAMTQWRVAAEQPPHLACIAPWEGTTDLYRESAYEGGIPATAFMEGIVGFTVGDGYIDDMVANAEKCPFLNAYWEDKIARLSQVRIPTYATASWSHLHLRGSIEGFRKIRTPKKWLRIHREFEWPDAYCSEGVEDLRRFYDRYLKDIRNGWELTPKVRVEVMDAYDYDFQTNRPEKEFPLARTQYEKLYLNAADGSLSRTPVSTVSKASYASEDGETVFDIRFEEDVEITGYMKLHAWVEADGHDDMDLFVNIQKLDDKGNFLPTNVLGEPHPGAWGKLRVSRRELDPKLSTDWQPVLAHKRDLKLSKGEIVPVEIEIWPHSRIWHKGQQLRVQIAGRYIRGDWFEKLIWNTDNKGSHIIHTGGEYDSFLQIPVIPPRYQAGDYIYR